MKQQPDAKIIYDSEHIRIVHKPGNGGFALINFSHAEHFVKDRHFWGESIAAKAGLEAIGVVPVRANWFPMGEMHRAAPAIRAALAHQSRRVGFGTSMGGYGALKFGRLLEMTHALAFVPQWSIDPADVISWDSRFTKHFRKDVHHSVAINAGDVAPTAAIVYDPFMKLDRLNFNRIIEADPHAVGIRSYCTAHSSVETFAGSERMLSLIRLLIDANFGEMQRRANEERRDRRSAIRPLSLAQMMVARDTTLAARIAEVHGDKFTTRQKASLHNDLACRLFTKGDFKSAHTHSLAANALFLDRDFRLRLSMIEHMLGDNDRALALALDVAAMWPGHANTHLHLSTILSAESRIAEALVEVKEVLRLEPSNQLAKKRLANWSSG